MKRRIIKSVVFTLMVLMLAHLRAASSPTLAQQPTPQMAPMRWQMPKLLSVGKGFVPPPMDLSYLTGKRMPRKLLAQALPSRWDWRERGMVTPVKDQDGCGDCYAFASIANIESKLLLDGAGTYDLSENNAKECNWEALLPGSSWSSCGGGNYLMLANLFSQKGTVLESCDPYIADDVDCNDTCPYQQTLLDWRIISGDSVPDTEVLKTYIYNYGPVYTTMYASFPDFSSYDGSYTLYYTGKEDPNHTVLIVGWDDDLTHAGGKGGWIVKNSWGTNWGDNGYFTIAYGSANIGEYSSFMYGWQEYDPHGDLMYYDEDGWGTSFGYGGTVGWGLCTFTPVTDTMVTRVEFWTTDATTDVDVYIYDEFNGTTLDNKLYESLGHSFNEAGYHSVIVDPPLSVTGGDEVIAVVKFTNASWPYPIPADYYGPYETGKTFISADGSSWTDLGANWGYDVSIRLRTSSCAFPGDVNGDGVVDTSDIQQVVDLWRCRAGDSCYDELYDVNNDGDIDILDVLLVAAHWGKSCNPHSAP